MRTGTGPERHSSDPRDAILALALRAWGIDSVTLLVLPAVLFVLALFVYPFLYGL
jgi:putative spermidine/putrescine transport system permease protein